MAFKAQEALGVQSLSVVADKGYYNAKEILACDTVGIITYVSKPLTSANTALGLSLLRFSGHKGRVSGRYQ